MPSRAVGVIRSGGMARAIGGLAVKAGHTVEVTSRDAGKACRAGEGTRLRAAMDAGPRRMAQTLEHACLLTLGRLAQSIQHAHFSIGISVLGRGHHHQGAVVCAF